MTSRGKSSRYIVSLTVPVAKPQTYERALYEMPSEEPPRSQSMRRQHIGSFHWPDKTRTVRNFWSSSSLVGYGVGVMSGGVQCQVVVKSYILMFIRYNHEDFGM